MVDLCRGCNKKVAKAAKALACDLCCKWYHGPFGVIEDADYDFMKYRRGMDSAGFTRNVFLRLTSSIGLILLVSWRTSSLLLSLVLWWASLTG